MKKIEDKNTRYYIDLNLKNRTIADWDYDQRDNLSQKLEDPNLHRIFLTKGQYYKFIKNI